MFPWSNYKRRATPVSLAANVAAGVLFGLVSYFGLFGTHAKHQVLWAILVGVFIAALSFFMYRWRTNDPNSDPEPNLSISQSEQRKTD